MVRECVWRINLQKPSYAKLLDISHNYWLSHGIEDWGIVIEKEDQRSMMSSERIIRFSIRYSAASRLTI